MMPLSVRPAIDPIRKATWLIPRDRPSSCAGVASTIIAALFVNRIAEPRPWIARKAITWAGSTARLVRREPTVNTAKPLVYSLTRPTMSEMRPMRRSATVLPRTYAWVIQIACSASARRLAATCGRPTITIRESIPAISTPTVVTVRTVHLYWIRLASVGGLRAAHPRATRFGARRSSRNTLRFLLTRGDERGPGSSHAHTLNRMVAGDQVPRHPEVPAVLSDRAALLGRLDGHRRVDDVPPLFDLHGLDVEVPEDVRDELVRVLRVLDDVDVLVDQALQLRDVLALLADRLPDVALLDDEDEFVARVDAVHDRRPGEILE